MMSLFFAMTAWAGVTDVPEKGIYIINGQKVVK